MDKPLFKSVPFILLILATLTVFALLPRDNSELIFKTINLKGLKISEVIAALTGLIVISLLIEQFIEIFISDPDKEEKERLGLLQENVLKDLSQVRKTNNRFLFSNQAIGAGANTAAEDNLVKKQAQVTFDKKILEKKRSRQTLIIAFVIGLIIAFIGVRLITGFLPMEGIKAQQETALNMLDIVLTAGLFAGGSNGIHKVLKAIQSSLAKT